MRLKEADMKQLERLMRDMSERSKLYFLIKKEMERRGHWKQLPRGMSFKPNQDIRRNKLNK